VNRKQRRSQSRSKSNARKTGLTYLTVAGVMGGSLGLAAPARADASRVASNCQEFMDGLAALADPLGDAVTLSTTLNFSDSVCELTSSYSFSRPSTITGPTNVSLTLNFNPAVYNLSVFAYYDSLSVSNLNFTKATNVATDHFLRAFDQGDPLTVSNSTFSDASLSAAIYAEGNLTVSDSTFKNLNSDSSGAAIYQAAGSETDIINSTFTANSSFSRIENDEMVPGNGGAIYATGPLTVTNSTFTGNQTLVQAGIYAEGALPDGGAIYSNASLTVTNSTFDSNSSSRNGGAIYFDSNVEDSITINNSSFYSNSAGGPGGAISFDGNAEGSLIVSNSTFTRNESPVGGAIWSNGKVQVNGSSFSENNASLSSGAIHNGGGYGELSVTDSAFDSNKALYAGGAIFSEGGLSLTVQDSSFIENGETTSDGGAIAVDTSEVRIGNSTFSENTGAQGAALYMSLSEGSSPTVTNSTFWNNKSSEVTSGSVVGRGSPISFFGNILANNDSSNVISEDYPSIVDLGANLYTDDSFVPDTGRSGEGASRAVTATSLDLGTGTPGLNTTKPINLGTTKTIAIGPNSIARDFYRATSAGIQPQNPVLYSGFDQRGVARPIGTGYDVGAFEYGEDPVVVPVETPAVVTKATIAAQKIKFAPGSSKLSKASKKKLRTLAAEIQAKGLKTVNLEGYTATLTKAAPSGKVLRVKLSKARATAVEKYLKQQFKKSGYSVTFTKSPKGAANRVKSNQTEKGRADNRRVEITIN
jgi:predicted outer membrane repeat protein